MRIIVALIGILSIMAAFLYAYTDVYKTAQTGTRVMWVVATLNIVTIWFLIAWYWDRFRG